MGSKQSGYSRLGGKEEDVVESEGKDGRMQSPHWPVYEEAKDLEVSGASAVIVLLYSLFARTQMRIGGVDCPMRIVKSLSTSTA